MQCDRCSSALPANAKFCLECGAPAEAAPSAPVASNDPLAGALERALGAQYELMRLLGRGGMGAVYLARERLLERLIAIKVLPRESGAGEARERFLREARIAARLSHPHIVPLYSFGEAEGLLFYVMGYVSGESLESRIRREGALTAEVSRRVLAEIADALQYAHQRGIVHRDLKPDNILIEQDTGAAMLTDFGIAKTASTAAPLTQTGMAVGTPHYMSPEQVAGDRDVDARSDLYSLGIVGFRMLTGRLPFDASNLQELLVQQVTKPAPSLATLTPQAPPALVAAIAKCLEKAPSDRLPGRTGGTRRSGPRRAGSWPLPTRAARRDLVRSSWTRYRRTGAAR